MRTFFRTAVLAALSCAGLAGQGSVAGEWMITVHEQFGPNTSRLSLAVSGDTLTGSYGGRTFEGTVKGSSIEFTLDNAAVKGTLDGSELKGEAVFPDRTVKWSAVRIPARPDVGRTHDFEPTVFHQYFSSSTKVIASRNPGHPLAETAEFLISIGIGGSLDQALQQATSGMVRWLDRDYKLNANEAAMVLGFAVKYDVLDLVGTQVSIAAKLPKAAIGPLAKK